MSEHIATVNQLSRFQSIAGHGSRIFSYTVHDGDPTCVKFKQKKKKDEDVRIELHESPALDRCSEIRESLHNIAEVRRVDRGLYCFSF